jgi:hypothetical protein
MGLDDIVDCTNAQLGTVDDDALRRRKLISNRPTNDTMKEIQKRMSADARRTPPTSMSSCKYGITGNRRRKLPAGGAGSAIARKHIVLMRLAPRYERHSFNRALNNRMRNVV